MPAREHEVPDAGCDNVAMNAGYLLGVEVGRRLEGARHDRANLKGIHYAARDPRHGRRRVRTFDWKGSCVGSRSFGRSLSA